jgi:hypothetical protein
MVASRQVNSIGGEGTLCLHLSALILDSAIDLGIGDTILDAGGPDHNRATLEQSPPLKVPKGRYLGIRPADSRESYGYLGDPDRARSRQDARRAVDIGANSSHVQAARERDLDCPFHLWIYSVDSGHTEPSRERLEDLQVRLPHEIRLGYTVLPAEQYLRDGITRDPQFPVALKRRGLLEASVITDNRSVPVRRYGRSFQDDLVATGLGSLMAAINHFPNQRGPADVAHALGHYCALVGLGFGIRPVIANPEVWWYRPLRNRFGWAPRGGGNRDDLIIQVTSAIECAIQDPDWHALDEDVDPNKQAFVAITVPLRRRDARWRPLVAETELWLNNQHPYITPLWVSGSGVADPQLATTTPYWVQATLFYALPDLPRPIRAILHGPTAFRPTDSEHRSRRRRRPGRAPQDPEASSA